MESLTLNSPRRFDRKTLQNPVLVLDRPPENGELK